MPNPSTCVVSGVARNHDGTPMTGGQIRVHKVLLTGSAIEHANNSIYDSPKSGADGIMTLTLPRNSTAYLSGPFTINNVDFSLGKNSRGRAVTIPDAATANLEDLPAAGSVPSQGLTVESADVALSGLFGILNFSSSFSALRNGLQADIGLKPATAGLLGGIKVGAGLTVTGDGTLSADIGSTEAVQDALASFFPDAAPFDWTYDDAGNRVTLSIANATPLAAGLMSAADKSALDAVPGSLTALSSAVTALDADLDALTLAVGTPTSANTPSAIVRRDASGLFDAGLLSLTAQGFNLGTSGTHEPRIYISSLDPTSKWLLGTSHSDSNGVQDNVLNLGWNNNSDNPADFAWFIQFEESFKTGPNPGDAVLMEFHLNYRTPAGFVIRPIGASVDRATHVSTLAFASDSLSWLDSAGVQRAAWSKTTGWQVLFGGYSSTQNNTALLSQSSTTGTLIEVARVDASNQVVIASGGARDILLDGPIAGDAFFRNGILIGNNGARLSNAGSNTLEWAEGPLNVGKGLVVNRYQTAGASSVIMRVRSTNLQTGNLTDWEDKDGAVLASVSAAGVFTGQGTGLTGVLKTANNLSDLPDKAVARTNLQLGTMATEAAASYALLAGRTGGQSLFGGTASGESLTLNSTAHATKGFIYFGAGAAYDGVNIRFGVGTLTPDSQLTVRGAAARLRISPDTPASQSATLSLFRSGITDWTITHDSSNNLNIARDGTSNLFISSAGLVGINKSASLGAQVHVVSSAASTLGLIVNSAATPSANIAEFQTNGSVGCTISENGYFTTRKTSAPADAELAAGEMALWFDSTNGAAKLMVKAKQADGTVRTGSLALT